MTHRAVFMGPERGSSTEAAADFDRLMVLVRMFAPDLIGGHQVPLGPGCFEAVADAFQRIREDAALEAARLRDPGADPARVVRVGDGRRERS